MLQFDGAIAGMGTASGTRLVVGMWPLSPYGESGHMPTTRRVPEAVPIPAMAPSNCSMPTTVATPLEWFACAGYGHGRGPTAVTAVENGRERPPNARPDAVAGLLRHRV